MYNVAVLGLLVSLPLLVIGADGDKKLKKKDNDEKSRLLHSKTSVSDYSSDHGMLHLIAAPIERNNSWLMRQDRSKTSQKKKSNGVHNGHSNDCYYQDYGSEHENGQYDDYEMISLQDEETPTKKVLSPIHSNKAERWYKEVLKNTHKYDYLKELDLPSANIKGKFNLGDIIFEMRQLREINLDNNEITKLVGKIDHRHTALRYFSAANNKLTFIKLSVFFTGFPNLKRLNVDHNQGLTIDSDGIVNITECTVSCKNCNLSPKDLASLAQNASYGPQCMPIENLFAARREREKPAYKFQTC